jgi:hypothetical protein
MRPDIGELRTMGSGGGGCGEHGAGGGDGDQGATSLDVVIGLKRDYQPRPDLARGTRTAKQCVLGPAMHAAAGPWVS